MIHAASLDDQAPPPPLVIIARVKENEKQEHLVPIKLQRLPDK